MPQRLPLSTRARPPLKRAKDPAGGIKFYWKIHLVLDCDTFRLELDYRSIVQILVKVLYNQARTTFHGAVTSEGGDYVAWDGGVSSMAGLNLLCDHTSIRCCYIEPRTRGAFCSLHSGVCFKVDGGTGCGSLKERNA